MHGLPKPKCRNIKRLLPSSKHGRNCGRNCGQNIYLFIDCFYKCYQLAMAWEDRNKTPFIMDWGPYQYEQMPLGAITLNPKLMYPSCRDLDE